MDIEHLAGTKLGNYEIENLLGRGGMGVVYKARQISLNRLVALKVLPPALSVDPSYIKRFQLEAQAVARLSHPNIVQIHDIAADQNLHFFSMEYVRGKTLDKVLEEKGKLELNEAVGIISQAALAVEHAHANGIIHRDIKPSNIILDESGNVKVMDFGLARKTEEASKLTRPGTLMGTLEYMSPEQIRGDALDGRTDIYSLGVVFYEALSGRVPFEAPNEAALINKIINEDPADIQTLNPNISISLRRIILKAMEKDRENRYPEIGDLLEDLRSSAEVLKPFKATKPLGMDIPRASNYSIAVLPFVDMSQQKDQEYFCEGIAEELINALAQLKDLQVIARISAFSFKGQDLDVREIGKKLDVDTVLQGSVRKAGNKIRITAQLADTASGHYLWSEKYDRELEDIFAIQDEITVAIVNRLKPKLLSAEEAKPAIQRTSNPEAHDLCLKGRYFLNRWTPTDAEKAISCFEKAIEKDSDYALAYVELADSYNMLSSITPIRPNDIFPKATKLVLKALKIDDTISDAHELLGWIKCVYEWNWANGERELRLALELNPGNLDAHSVYAQVLTFMGRYEEAIEFARRGVELDPLSPIANIRLADVLNNAGKFEESTQYLQKSIEMFSDYAYARMNLGGAYLGQFMYEEALREFQAQKDLSLGPLIDVQVDSNIGAIYAFIGETAKAEKILVDLEEKSRGMYVPPSFVGRLYYVLGHHNKAFEWLERAYEEHDFYLCHLPILTRTYAPDLLSDPRYQALLRRIGLDK